MGTNNQMAIYERINISDDLVYEWVRLFLKGQVYEWGKFRNTGSNTRTTITIPTPSYHLYPRPRPFLYFPFPLCLPFLFIYLFFFLRGRKACIAYRILFTSVYFCKAIDNLKLD